MYDAAKEKTWGAAGTAAETAQQGVDATKRAASDAAGQAQEAASGAPGTAQSAGQRASQVG